MGDVDVDNFRDVRDVDVDNFRDVSDVDVDSFCAGQFFFTILVDNFLDNLDSILLSCVLT